MRTSRRLSIALAITATLACSLVVAAGPSAAAAPRTSGRLSRTVGPLTPVTVSVSGRGLSKVKRVRFGSTVVRRLKHRGSTRLTLSTPRRRTPASVTVQVRSGRRWVSVGRYQFLAKPALRSLSNASGQPNGGTVIVLAGSALTPSPRVTFGAKAASIRRATATRLTVVVPPAVEGAVSVTVTTPGGRSAAKSFTYATPGFVSSSSYAAKSSTSTVNPADVQWVDGGPDPDDVAGTSQASWTISLAPNADVPTVGSGIYLAPGNSIFASGLTGVVGSVAAQTDGSTRVSVNPAPIDQTLSSASVNYSGGHLPAAPSGHVRRNEVTGEVDQDFAGEASYSDLDSGAFSCENKIGQEVSFSGSLAVTFTRLHPVANFSAQGPSFNIYLAGTVVVSGKVTAEEAMSCSLTPLWVDAHRKIIPIGTTGATISFGPAAEIKLSVAGTVQVEQTTRFMYGVSKYMSDAPQFTHIAVSTPPQFSVNAEVALTASAGVSVQFGLLDRIGIEVKAQLFASGTASSPVTGPAQLCVSVDLGFSITIDAFLDLFVARWQSAARTYSVSFQAFHKCGPPVSAAPGSNAPVITSTVLPDGTVDDSYDTQLTTADNRDGTWQITGGTPPSGLTLDADGELSGTPENGVGTRRLSVQFTDDNSRRVTGSIELTIDPSQGLGGGDMQATLTWDGSADLDLHAIEPDGNEIYFGDRGPSDDGGELDYDSNAGCQFVDPSPTENIHWPADEAESGLYYIFVQTYNTCDSADLNWHLVVRIRGQVVLDTTGYDTSQEYEIDYGTAGSNARPTVRLVPHRAARPVGRK